MKNPVKRPKIPLRIGDTVTVDMPFCQGERADVVWATEWGNAGIILEENGMFYVVPTSALKRVRMRRRHRGRNR